MNRMGGGGVSAVDGTQYLYCHARGNEIKALKRSIKIVRWSYDSASLSTALRCQKIE